MRVDVDHYAELLLRETAPVCSRRRSRHRLASWENATFYRAQLGTADEKLDREVRFEGPRETVELALAASWPSSTAGSTGSVRGARPSAWTGGLRTGTARCSATRCSMYKKTSALPFREVRKKMLTYFYVCDMNIS